MSKIALIADTHLGVRQDKQAFHDSNAQFFENIFFPTLEDQQVDNVIHLGDLFDHRTKIDVNTFEQAQQYLFTPLDAYGIKMQVILGNHDIYYRNSLRVNTLEQMVVEQYNNISVINQSKMTDYGVAIPWIVKENRQQAIDMLRDWADGQFVFGHFDLQGFQQTRTTLSQHGEDISIFAGARHVFSGHFHHRHTKGNITYCGSVQQHTWDDLGASRGFHILDVDTGELQFFENPYKLFTMIEYNADKPEFDNVKGQYVRIKYGQLEDYAKFDAFVKQVQAAGAVDNVQTIPTSTVMQIEHADVNIDVEDTPTLINNFVTEQPVADKLISLYNQAKVL